jgi:serine/threonine protein kinase
LGSGAFGVVYRGSLEVAIKQVPISVSTDDEFDYLKTLLEREVNVMQTLSQENILKLIDISMTKNNIYLIMEFCNEGDIEIEKKT